MLQPANVRDDKWNNQQNENPGKEEAEKGDIEENKGFEKFLHIPGNIGEAHVQV